MKCLDCSNMVCKQYFVHDDKWTGYCTQIRDTVSGDDPCRWTKQLQLDFFSDNNKNNKNDKRRCEIIFGQTEMV